MILNKIKHLYNILFLSPEKYARKIGVKIGKGCLIADYNHWSSEPYLVTIGDNVQLTTGVKIHTHGGGHVLRKTHSDFDVFGKVEIKNWVYIGAFSQIMPGVTIEDNVVIASGSVVTKSVPSGVVIGGNPAKILCTVEEYKQRNFNYNVHSKQMSSFDKKVLLLNLPEEKFLKKPFLDNKKN